MQNSRMSAAILPGQWLGVLGGGQLGRMMTHAAQRMGYHVAVYDPDGNCPAGQPAERLFCDQVGGAEQMVCELAELCAAVTLEFENIPASLVQLCAERTIARPDAFWLETCQDRILEKTRISQAGFPTTPFEKVCSQLEVQKAAEGLGWPLVLKTARAGYDGKGQVIVHGADQVGEAWMQFNCDQIIAEKWVEYRAEVSMIAARNQRGDVECYPLIQNEHAQHILDISRCPVDPSLAALQSQASEVCHGVANHFRVEGLFCIEFFITGDDELLINEVAPRPHNSGHLTIEAFTCSQFEQQVRAVCNLPLLPAQQLKPAAMANLLGDLWGTASPDWSRVLAQPAAHLHLYGKSQARPGRKMGHLTVLDDHDASTAVHVARELRTAVDRAQR